MYLIQTKPILEILLKINRVQILSEFIEFLGFFEILDCKIFKWREGYQDFQRTLSLTREYIRLIGIEYPNASESQRLQFILDECSDNELLSDFVEDINNDFGSLDLECLCHDDVHSLFVPNSRDWEQVDDGGFWIYFLELNHPLNDSVEEVEGILRDRFVRLQQAIRLAKEYSEIINIEYPDTNESQRIQFILDECSDNELLSDFVEDINNDLDGLNVDNLSYDSLYSLFMERVRDFDSVGDDEFVTSHPQLTEKLAEVNFNQGAMVQGKISDRSKVGGELLLRFPATTMSNPSNQPPNPQSFILEPILTPSGIYDGRSYEQFDSDDDSELVDTDIKELVVDDFEPTDSLDNNAELLPFLDAIEAEYSSGVFTVGESSEVGIDFLFDGGCYQGEVGIFSLEGIDAAPGSKEFIHEAARRALSGSDEGHVVIRDRAEGAKFTGTPTEGNLDRGDYGGPVIVEMQAGDRFGILLTTNHTITEVYEGKDWDVMFSMVTKNSDNDLKLGQMVDVTGEGNTFVFEDLDVDGRSDRDYNDIVLSIRGAEVDDIPLMDDLLSEREADWRETEVGQELIDYVTSYVVEDTELVVTVGDRFLNPNEPLSMIGRVEDIKTVDTIEVLLKAITTDEWIVQVLDTMQVDEDGRFEVIAEGLAPGRYEYKTIITYESGFESTTEIQKVTVLSLSEGEELSDRAMHTLERVVDLDRYDPEVLAQTWEWVVSVSPDTNVDALAAKFGAINLGSTDLVANTYRWELPEGFNLDAWQSWIESQSELEYVYPLISFTISLCGPSSEVSCSHQWHLTESTVTNVWNQDQPIYGKGINIGIVDVGFETGHTGLVGNYLGDVLNVAGVSLSKNFDNPEQGISSQIQQELKFKPRHIANTSLDLTKSSDHEVYWQSCKNIYPFALSVHFSGSLKDLQFKFTVNYSNAANLEIYLLAVDSRNVPYDGTRIPLLQGAKDNTAYQFTGHDFEVLFGDHKPIINGQPVEDWNWCSQRSWALAISDNKPNDEIHGQLRDFVVQATYENRHGTLVAGVAADGHYGQQGSGVAPHAGWAALQVGVYGTNDLKLTGALTHNSQEIDIYQSSWGLDFFGQTANTDTLLNDSDALLYSWEVGLARQIRDGRDGKGNIYVFAGGNENDKGGRVDYNSFASNRHTIAVGAVGRNTTATAEDPAYKAASYSNPGASLLISALSSDRLPPDGIDNNQTNQFGGTSAAAPFVSGVVALMLEVNPHLTWRDVQHILIKTASREGLVEIEGEYWTHDHGGVDVKHHHYYGFGLVDPEAAVKAAEIWKPLNQEITVAVNRSFIEKEGNKRRGKTVKKPSSQEAKQGKSGITTFDFDFSKTQAINLEAVELEFNGKHLNRRNLKIILKSPDGTESVLSDRHVYDYGLDPSYDWTFTSLRHWGESSLGRVDLPSEQQGCWQLIIEDYDGGGTPGSVSFLEIRLHGTSLDAPTELPKVEHLDQEDSYIENQPLALKPIEVTNASGKVTVKIELPKPEAGRLTSGGLSSDTDGVLTIVGMASEVTIALSNLTFVPAPDFDEPIAIATSVQDEAMASPLHGVIDLASQPINDASGKDEFQVDTIPPLPHITQLLPLSGMETTSSTGASPIKMVRATTSMISVVA